MFLKFGTCGKLFKFILIMKDKNLKDKATDYAVTSAIDLIMAAAILMALSVYFGCI